MKKINLLEALDIILFIIWCMAGGMISGNWHWGVLIPYYPHIRLYQSFLLLTIIFLGVIIIILMIIRRKKEKKENVWDLKKYLILIALILAINTTHIMTAFSIMNEYNKITEYKIADTVTYNDVDFSIVNVERKSIEDDSEHERIIIDIKITNNSDEDTPYSPAYLGLEVSINGQKRSISAYNFHESDVVSMSLDPGYETSKRIVYDIDKDAENIRLCYYPKTTYANDMAAFAFIIEE